MLQRLTLKASSTVLPPPTGSMTSCASCLTHAMPLPAAVFALQARGVLVLLSSGGVRVSISYPPALFPDRVDRCRIVYSR